MYDHNQIEIPASFMALHIESGRLKPTAQRADIARRYELCEDLAQHLCDHARAQWQDLGIAESDVLQRCHRGLLSGTAGVDAGEAAWVVRRLAELQGWDWTDHAPAP